MSILYGNEKLISFFHNASQNNKLAHAYIFEGGRGSGKHTAARYLACLLACGSLTEKPCFECDSCKKIIGGISPDIIEVELPKDKKQLGVERVREIRSSAFVMPNEEDVKIFIIGDAHTMTVQAQNVLLKVLEEPPNNVYFFLLCENTSNILATVRSRAPVLKMQVFGDGELSDYMVKNNSKAAELYKNSPGDFELIIKISEGKIGEAQRFLLDVGKDKEQSRRETAGELVRLSSNMAAKGELLEFAVGQNPNREALQDILLYASYALRDIMAVKKTDSDNARLLFYENRESARRMAGGFTTAGVMNVYLELEELRNELSLNVNISNSLVFLVSRIKSAANS